MIDRLAAYGDAPALLTGAGTVSYRALAARVAEVAASLGAGRRLVLVEGANSVDALVAYLACLAARHPVLLAPPAAVDALVAAYDPDVVVRGAAVEERRAGSAHVLHDDLALLLTTSGSTGSPKLVRLSYDSVLANAESIATYLGIGPDDRAATTLPMHYCYGLSVVNSHLLRGAALVLTDLSVVDPCFWERFRAARATTFAGVPYTFDLLDRVGFAEMDLPHLRYVTQAGGRLAPERVRSYARLGRERGWDLVVMYGQTEATARMAYLPPHLAESHPSAIGVPVPGGSFAIEDGELVYSGPNVMLGYATSPADLALGRVVHRLRTGDLARCVDGLYEVVGRRSRFAKVFGLRLDLDHVEALLAARGVTAACADADGALAVLVEGPCSGIRDAVAAACGVPPRAVRVRSVDALPRLANGKVDYAFAVPAASPAPSPPADLCALYAAVLERPRVTPDDSFVSLGGDSLSYVELSLRVEAALGHLPPGWHVTPIRALAPLPRRRSWLRSVETSVLLRAAAILLVVGSHANLFDLLGGAHVLLAVAGFNFARFQLGRSERRDRVRHALRAVARIALPSMVWIGALVLLTPRYGLANVLLLNHLLGPPALGPNWEYWFVEALVGTLLVVTALLALPRVHRLERRAPFGFPAALLGLGLLARYGVVSFGRGTDPLATAHTLFWLFALGWCAARATSWSRRVLVSAVAVLAVPGFFPQESRTAVVAAGVLLLAWAPSLRVPAFLVRPAGVLASASLYVYLVHWQVFPHLQWRSPLLAVVASFAGGIAYWQLATRALPALSRTRVRLALPVRYPRPASA